MVQSQRTSSRNHLVLPVIAGLLSFYLNWSLIGKGPYHLDCLDLIIKAEKMLSTGQMDPLFGPGYPLTVILAAVFIFISRLFSISDSAFAVNFMSVVFGALSVFSFYILVRKLLDETTALFSSLMLAVCPLFLGLSVYGKNHTLSLFFLIQGFSWLVSFLKTDRSKYFWGAAISLGLMGATREQDLALMSLPIIFLFFCGFSEQGLFSRRLRAFGVFWACVLFVVLIFHLPFFRKDTVGPYIAQFLVFWDIGIEKNSWKAGILVKTFQFMLQTLSLFGLLVAVAGLLRLALYQLRIFGFIILWIIVPLFFYGMSHSMMGPRFLLIMLPPLIIAQGYMFAEMTRKRPWKYITHVAFVLTAVILFGSIFPVLKFRHDHALLPDFARWVGERTEPQAQIIAGDERTFILYYAKRAVLHRPTSNGKLDIQEMLEFKQSLDKILSNGTPVYITTAGLYSYDRESHFSDFFTQHYELQGLGARDYEDWHSGELILNVLPCELLRIRTKG